MRQNNINLSYIIGHRGVAQERVDNLYAVISFLYQYFANIEIIVVEQDAKPSHLILPGNAKYLFLFNPGLYNRAWGFNVAIKHANHNIVAFADNDIIVPPEAITQAYTACIMHGTASPYNSKKLLDLSYDATQSFLATNQLNNLSGKPRPCCNYAGGILFMSKPVFRQLGGWEERMRGWGGEDSQLFIKIQKLNIPVCELEYPGYHLYHERNQGKPQLHNPLHKNNVTLCQNFKNMSPEEIMQDNNRRYPTIGNPNLYQDEHVITQPQQITKADAFINLCHFKQAAISSGVIFFLDNKTLLAAIKHQDFFNNEHSQITLTSFYIDWCRKDLLIANAAKMGFTIAQEAVDNTDPKKTPTLLFKRNSGEICLTFKKIKTRWLWWTTIDQLYFKVPNQYVVPLQQISFNGEFFLAPGNIKEYLNYRYGCWLQDCTPLQENAMVTSFEQI